MKITELQRKQYHEILDSLLDKFDEHRLDGIDDLTLVNISTNEEGETTINDISAEIILTDNDIHVETIIGSKTRYDMNDHEISKETMEFK